MSLKLMICLCAYLRLCLRFRLWIFHTETCHPIQPSRLYFDFLIIFIIFAIINCFYDENGAIVDDILFGIENQFKSWWCVYVRKNKHRVSWQFKLQLIKTKYKPAIGNSKWRTEEKWKRNKKYKPEACTRQFP